MDKVAIYQAKDGYRWHRTSENGKVVAESGEAYENKSHAREMAEDVNGGDYEIKDET